MGISEYTGAWDTPRVVHLLKRTLFGATVQDIDYLRTRTMSQAVDELLQPTPVPAAIPLNNYGNDPTGVAPWQTWIDTGLLYVDADMNLNRLDSLQCVTITPTLKVSKAGVYTVSIDGCGVNDSLGVFFSDTPRLDLGKDHVMCDSANLLLNAASQNGQYTWSLNGAVLPVTEGQLLTHYPGGNYEVVVDVPGCGTYKDAVAVTYASPVEPSFDLGPDTLLCPKEVYTLTADLSGATSFDWSTGSVADSIRVTEPDTYWVFVTCNGQCQVTDSVLVRYRGDRPLDFHDTDICKGSTLSLNADFGVGRYKWEAIPPYGKPGDVRLSASFAKCVYARWQRLQ
jgi:hypothetical protein